MSKAGVMDTEILFHQTSKNAKDSNQFNLMQSEAQSSFHNTFNVVSLEEKEASSIERLLVDNYQPGMINEEQVQTDCEALKGITAEIRAINKQGVLLLGKRIQKARDLLKNYGDGQGVFTQWLVKTFGNRRTAYNILSYYEFYQSLPNEGLKMKLRSMPVQAVYTLASRDGPLDVKKDIIKNYAGEKQKDTILLIQERIPLLEGDKRKKKEAISSSIENLERLCETFEKRKEYLTETQRTEVKEILSRFSSILS